MIKAYLKGNIGCEEWLLSRTEPQQEEGFEILVGEYDGRWFKCDDSGLFIQVVDGRTSGRWMEEEEKENYNKWINDPESNF